MIQIDCVIANRIHDHDACGAAGQHSKETGSSPHVNQRHNIVDALDLALIESELPSFRYSKQRRIGS